MFLEALLHVAEDELGNLLDVRAVRQDLRARRHDVIRRDVVADLDDDFLFDDGGQRRVLGQRADVRSLHDLDAFGMLLFRCIDHRVIDEERLRLFGQVEGGFARVGDDARDRARRRRLGRDETDVRGERAAPALEVAVERAQGPGVRHRRLSHADAGAACAFQETCARREDLLEAARFHDHGENLARAGREDEGDVRRDALAVEDGGDRHDVAIRRVRAAADGDLVDRLACDLAHRLHDVGHVRQRDQRLQRGEIDHIALVVDGALVGRERTVYVFPALAAQEVPRHLIAREDRRRRAKLRAHIRDGRALGHGQRLHAVPRILDNLADAALDREQGEHLQDDVLRAHALSESARQMHLGDARHVQHERLARHRARDVEAARADREHTDAAARRRVRIAAEERRARPSEALKVHLMTDAVAGAREEYAVLLRDRLQILVIVGILEAALQGVVVDIADGKLRLDLIDAHRLKLQVRHRARRILRQRLVDAYADRRSLFHLARHEMLVQDLFRQCQRFCRHKDTPFAAAPPQDAQPLRRPRQSRLCFSFHWKRRMRPPFPFVKLSQSGASVNTSMQILL